MVGLIPEYAIVRTNRRIMEETKSATFSEAPPPNTNWLRFRRVFFSRPAVVFGLVVLAILLLTTVFANWLAPYDPYQQNMANTLKLPSAQHILGTDQFGRDTLSRLIYGSRTAMTIGFISVSVAAIIGITLGALAGYFGGPTGMIAMRFVDTLMSFPLVLLALMIAAVLGGGMKNVIIALSIATIPPYARVMNGETLSIKENDYIAAIRNMGASKIRIIMRHILPNAFPPIMVLMTLQLGQIILAEASLSFLGIGIESPGAAWGSMVSDGYRFLRTNPVLSFAPGAAIMLVVFAFNMVGDGLTDVLDPRLRGTL
jgi:peptide/nickel transport system permease protein